MTRDRPFAGRIAMNVLTSLRIVGTLACVTLFGLAMSAAAGSPSTASVAQPQVSGQSQTALPDGRQLLLGGEEQERALASATIFDATAKTIVPLAHALAYARSAHTATVLPDGTVLILGGIGTGG